MSAPGWERWASRVIRSVERAVDPSRGARVPRRVVAYRGFGNENEVFVMGRVLADPAPREVSADDTWWHNLTATFRHLESDEVAGARVRVRLEDAHVHAVTDDEGYYRAWLRTPSGLRVDGSWHETHISVSAPPGPPRATGAANASGHVRSDTEVQARGRVLLPPSNAEYGVISDLDDTVIRTDATRLLMMLKRTLLDNARTRLPFPGVAEFYTGLHCGASASARNPVFYVSSSPWNLYPVLSEFLEHHSVPAGPLMLRDWGISEHGILPTRHGTHKLGAIRQILNTYPKLPFILIGDSGQEDPEIYSEVVHEFTSRILAVYIRNVASHPERIASIQKLAAEVRKAGSDLLLSDDTLAGARHAADCGWLHPAAVETVAAAVSSSAGNPG